jgi:hypothetical protein
VQYVAAQIIWYDTRAILQTVDNQERRVCSTEQTLMAGAAPSGALSISDPTVDYAEDTR